MQNKSQNKVLNNKIGIQILVIIISIAVFALGILCCCDSYTTLDSYPNTIYLHNYNGNKISYYFSAPDYYSFGSAFTYVGIIIILVSVAAFIVASIKIANYCFMKQDIKKSSKQNTQNSASQGSLDDIKNKMISLKDMKDNGLISDTDYEEMKSKLINNCGSNL